jgi:hypothetical protein
MDSSDSSALALIKEEIDQLQDEQNAAMKYAAYIGMTPAGAKQCEERRRQITVLMQKMMDLQRTVEPTEPVEIPLANEVSPPIKPLDR